MYSQPEGTFIEWKAVEEEYELKSGSTDAESWAVVDAVSYKSQSSESGW